MGRHLPAALAPLAGAVGLLALAACAPAAPELAAPSPDGYCRQHGVTPDSALFEGCRAAVVAAQCAGDDPALQARCERRLSAR